MPEGHIIHRLAREFGQTLAGAPVRASSPQGRFADGAALLDGTCLHNAEAWGKYLFCDFGVGEVLHVHLGLIGKFHRRPSPPPEPVGTVRLRLEGAGATWDLSGPTRCELVTPEEQSAIVARIGPDPLRRDARRESVHERLGRTRRPIGATLLDQRIISGIGNVYRAELLFLCGIHPLHPSDALSEGAIDELWRRAVELMRIGMRMGRIVTTDPAEIGRPRSRIHGDDCLYVYHREHCRRCGTAIEQVAVGGRLCWYCPIHQRAVPGLEPA